MISIINELTKKTPAGMNECGVWVYGVWMYDARLQIADWM